VPIAAASSAALKPRTRRQRAGKKPLHSAPIRNTMSLSSGLTASFTKRISIELNASSAVRAPAQEIQIKCVCFRLRPGSKIRKNARR